MTPAKVCRSTIFPAKLFVTASNRPFMIDQKEVNVSGSIGITLFPGDVDSEQKLLNNADEAMYLAKWSGRNQLCFLSVYFQPLGQA